MKSFIELVTEIKKSFDQEDNNVLANIENSIELTSIATVAHATDSYLIYNKKLYKVIDDIAVGDTLDPTATTGNIELADDIMSMIETLRTENQATSDEIADMNNVLGAKNLLPNIGVGTSTNNGITYTKNSDGSVTANGTATGWAYYNLCSRFTLDAGTYILSGKEAKAATQIKLLNADTQADIALLVDNNTETQFTLNTKTTLHAMLYVGVDAGTVTNFVFYPMIRLASIADDTYVPYSMTNREMTPYVQAISNPNLLDNPWFTVNQRGFNSSVSVAYSFDRWWGIHSYDSTNKGILFAQATDWCQQKIDPDNKNVWDNKRMTLSVKYSDGSISSASFIYMAGLGVWTDIFNDGKLKSQLGTTGSISLTALTSCSIVAVKLELGSVSTLAMDTAPNYQQELAKCQRYYQIVGKTSATTGMGKTIASGPAFDASNVWMPIYLPVPMRTVPTVSVVGTLAITASGYGNRISDTSSGLVIGIVDFGEENVSIVNISCSFANSFTAGTFYKLCTPTTTTKDYIALSADL